MRKQEEKEDFWDKYKKLYSEYSSDKLYFKNSIFNKTSFKKDNLDKGMKRRNNTYESFGNDDNEGIL